MALIVELLPSRCSAKALELLEELAKDATLLRTLYLSEGLVAALVQRCMRPISSTGGMCETSTQVLKQLFTLLPNKVDFVRDGHAERFAGWAGGCSNNDKMQTSACKLLHWCIEHDVRREEGGEAVSQEEQDEEANELDDLRLEFMQLRAMIRTLLHSRDKPRSMVVFYSLTKSRCVIDDLLYWPGFVDTVLHAVESEDSFNSLFAYRTLLNVVTKSPVNTLRWRDLVCGLIHITVRGSTNRSGIRGQQVLMRWRVALSSSNGRVAIDPKNVTADKRALLLFWRNVRRMWAVAPVARLKQRSALRRLPVEILWSVREILCGGEGWHVS